MSLTPKQLQTIQVAQADVRKQIDARLIPPTGNGVPIYGNVTLSPKKFATGVLLCMVRPENTSDAIRICSTYVVGIRSAWAAV